MVKLHPRAQPVSDKGRAQRPVAYGFDGENPRAQRIAEQQAARLVTRVGEETRQALRALIVRSIREGIPPYEAARMIRDMVGLTDQQAQAAVSYRRNLINQGLTLERVNKLTDKYADRKLKERALNIARTETMDALNLGKLETWRQNRANGLLSKDTEKRGVVTPDEKLCPICVPLDQQVRPLDKPFVGGDGRERLMPPFHPRCRCTAVIADLKK